MNSIKQKISMAALTGLWSALGLFAALPAFAVKPLAVWNGDFADGNIRGDFKCYTQGNTVNNGIVTVDTKGFIFERQKVGNSSVVPYPCSVVIGATNVAYSTDAMRSVILIYTDPSTDKGKAMYGVSLSTDNKYKNCFDGNLEYGTGLDSDLTATDTVKYYALAHQGKSGGTPFYVDKVQKNPGTGFHSQNDSNYRGFVIGGRYGVADNRCNGMTVSYVAILGSSAAADVQAWSLTDMTSAETISSSGGDITSGTRSSDGVNLNGGTVNVTADTTVAALFVQENTTLNFADGAALTINGPLYVADGKKLTLSAAGGISREVITFGTAGFNSSEVAVANAATARIVTSSTSITYEPYVNIATVASGANIAWTELFDNNFTDNANTHLTLQGDATVEIDTDITIPNLRVTGTGTVTFKATKTPRFTAVEVVEPADYQISIPVDGSNTDYPLNTAWTVPAGQTFILECATDATTTLTGAITINGTLRTTGNIRITANENSTIAAGGTLEVVSGMNAIKFGDRKILGTLTIRPEAMYLAQRNDSLGYGSSGIVLNVYGTLAMGSYRWTADNSSRHTFNFYAGSSLTGAGDGNSSFDSSLDFYNGTGVINILPYSDETTVTFAGKYWTRSTLTFNVSSGVTLSLENAASRGTATFGTVNHSGSGTINIAANTTAPANSIASTLTYTGAGTLHYKSPTTALAADSAVVASLTNSNGWTGEMRIAATSSNCAPIPLADYGNASSSIRLLGLSGGNTYFPRASGDCTVAAPLYIDGDVTFNNGYSGYTYTLENLAGGAGDLTLSSRNTFKGALTYGITTLDADNYTGTISLINNGFYTAAAGDALAYTFTLGNIVKASPVYGTPLVKVTKTKTGNSANTLTFDLSTTTLNGSAASLVYDGSISGAEGVYLTSATYSGETYILPTALAEAGNAGSGTVTLTVDYSTAGDITVPAGVTLEVGTHTLAAGTLTVNGTVAVASAGSLSATAVTGSGTVTYTGRLPDDNIGWTNSTYWTGTVEIAAMNPDANAKLNLASYGNSGSKICLNGVSNYYLAKEHFLTEIVVGANGWTINNGYSDGYAYFDKLSGSGALTLPGNEIKQGYVVRNASGFTGPIDVNTASFTFTASDYGANSGNAATFHFGSGYDGRIYVGAGATATVNPGASGVSWSASNGIFVDGTIDIPADTELSDDLVLVQGSGTVTVGNTAELTVGGEYRDGWVLGASGNDIVVARLGDLTIANGVLTANDTLEAYLEHDDIAYGGEATATRTTAATEYGTLTVTGGTLLFDVSVREGPLSGNIVINSGATFQLKTVTGAKAAGVRITTGTLTIDSSAIVKLGETVIPATEYTVEDGAIFIGPETTILPWGDSITEGGGDTQKTASVNTLAQKSNYRTLLMEKLGKSGYNPRTVGFWDVKGWMMDGSDAPAKWRWHSGMYGHTAATYTNHAGESDAADAILAAVGCEPDVITFNLGINDLSFGTNGSALGVDVVFTAWTNLVCRIHTLSPSTRIVAAQLLDCSFDSNGNKVETFNSMIAAWAATPEAQAMNVTTVNLHDAVALNSENFHTSFVHPNWKGQDLSAETWKAGVMAVLDGTGKKNVQMGPLSAVNDLALAADNKVYVTFTRPVKPSSVSGAGATLSGDNAPALSTPELQGDGRTVAFTASAALTAGATYTVSVTGVRDYDDAETTGTTTLTVKTYGAEANIPAAYRAGMTKYKTADLPASGAGNISYAAPQDVTPPVNVLKMGYYLELERPGTHKLRYVWVDLESPENYFSFDNLLVPQSPRQFQGVVNKLHVYSNAASIQNVEPTDDTVRGVMEFTSDGVGGAASLPAPAPAQFNNFDQFDWNDTLNTSDYGMMQIHRIAPTSGYGRYYANSGATTLTDNPAEVLFAYNRWNTSGDNEIGIGNFGQHVSANNGFVAGGVGASYDYTFTYWLTNMNATAYAVRRVEFWAKPATVEYTVEEGVETTFEELIADDVESGDYVAGKMDVTVTVAEGATLTISETIGEQSFVVNGSGKVVADPADLPAGTTLGENVNLELTRVLDVGVPFTAATTKEVLTISIPSPADVSARVTATAAYSDGTPIAATRRNEAVTTENNVGDYYVSYDSGAHAITIQYVHVKVNMLIPEKVTWGADTTDATDAGAEYVTTTAQLAFPGMTLGEINDNYFLFGRMAGGWVNVGVRGRRQVFGQNKYVHTGANGEIEYLRYEMQLKDEALKCVIVKLTQGEDGVYAEATAARSEASGVLGYVFQNQGDAGAYNGTAQTVVTTHDGANGYAAYALTIKRKDLPELLYYMSFDELEGGYVKLANEAGVGEVAPTQFDDGNLTSVAEGKLGMAHHANAGTITFTDDDNGLGLSSETGYTMSFWWHPNNATTEWRDFFGFHFLETKNFVVEYKDNGSNKLAMYGWGAGVSHPKGELSYTYNPSDWNHVVIVCEQGGSDYKFYLNGVPDALTSNCGMTGTLAQINRGRNGNGNANCGSRDKQAVYYDDLAVYRGALTAEQVAALYNNGTGAAVPATTNSFGVLEEFVPTTYSATVSADTDWADIIWESESGDHYYFDVIPGIATLNLALADNATVTLPDHMLHFALLTVTGSGNLACRENTTLRGNLTMAEGTTSLKLAAGNQYYAVKGVPYWRPLGEGTWTDVSVDDQVVSGYTAEITTVDNARYVTYTAASAKHDSININFTNGSGQNLTTTSEVGAFGVAGTSWQNVAGSESAMGSAGTHTTTSDEVLVTESNGRVIAISGGLSATSYIASGAQGSKLSNVSGADNILACYLGEQGNNNNSPSVTVSGIPYAQYRVIVYFAHSDGMWWDHGRWFGYCTIGGVDYTSSNADRTTGRDFPTVHGTARWGAVAPANTCAAINEGVNYLVSGVISASEVTITGHGSEPSEPYTRGTIAAIQIVEVGAEATARKSLSATVSGNVAASDIIWTYDGTTTRCSSENLPSGADLNLTVEADASVAFGAFAANTLNVTGAGNATLVFDGAATISTLKLASTGTKTLVHRNGVATIASVVGANDAATDDYSVTIYSTSGYTAALTVPAGRTYTLIGGATAGEIWNYGGQITVNGTLKTQGHLNLTAENRLNSSGTWEVVDGSTKAKFGENGSGICGTLTIREGATFVNARESDALWYNGAAHVNVYGTLDMAATRWTINASDVLNFYAGSTITGVGEGEHGALDSNGAVTYHILANGEATTVNLSAKLRLRANPTFNIPLGLTVVATGTVGDRDNGTIAITGGGTFRVENGGSFPANTSFSVASGATLALGEGGSVAGAISGAGNLAVTGGTHRPNFNNFTGTITVDGGTITVPHTMANAITVNSGTLRVTVTDEEYVDDGLAKSNITWDGEHGSVVFVSETFGLSVAGETNKTVSGVTGIGFGAQGTRWTGDAGDGLWATKENWNPAYVPTTSTVASIGQNAEITVADTDHIGSVWVRGTGTSVTLKGTGTAQGTYVVASGCTLAFGEGASFSTAAGAAGAGTITLAETATFEMLNGANWTGAVLEGTGTLKVWGTSDGGETLANAFPTVPASLATGTADAGWRGTAWFLGFSDGDHLPITLDEFANVNSTIRLSGVTGHLTPHNAEAHVKAIELVDVGELLKGLTLDNGNSGETATVHKLIGSGTLRGSHDIEGNEGATQTYYFQDVSEFTGVVDWKYRNLRWDGTLTLAAGSEVWMNCVSAPANNSFCGSLKALSGATIDMKGLADKLASIELAGGTLTNTGNEIGDAHMTINSLVVSADSTITGTARFGVVNSGYNAATVSIAEGVTLTKTGNNIFHICHADIEGSGTIAVDEGTLEIYHDDDAFPDGTITVGANGRLFAQFNLEVKNLLGNGGTLTCSGEHAITVTGTFKPNFGAATSANVTMAANSVISLDGLDNATFSPKALALNGAVAVSGAGSLNIGTAVSGSGSLTVNSGATLALSNGATYTGTLALNGGTLSVNSLPLTPTLAANASGTLYLPSNAKGVICPFAGTVVPAGLSVKHLETDEPASCGVIDGKLVIVPDNVTIENGHIIVNSGETLVVDEKVAQFPIIVCDGGAISIYEREHAGGDATINDVEWKGAQNVNVIHFDGTTARIDSVKYDGAHTTTVGYQPQIAGNATMFDMTFTNTLRMAYSCIPEYAAEFNHDGRNANPQRPATYTNTIDQSYVIDVTNESHFRDTAILLNNRPFLEGENKQEFRNKFNTFYDNMSVAVAGAMPSTPNTIFFHLGSSNGSNSGMIIYTTADENKVCIAENEGTTLHPVTTLTVPNSATARHSYVITKTTDEAKTKSLYTVYVDGVKWKSAQLPYKAYNTGHGGIQVGGDFGGAIRTQYDNSEGASGLQKAETGYINVIRIYDRILTQKEINRYTEASQYPYDPPDGRSRRTLAGGDTTYWVLDDAWQIEDRNGTPAPAPRDRPVEKSEVILTTTAKTTINFNALAKKVEYSALIVESPTGEELIIEEDWRGVTNNYNVYISGVTTINAPLRIKNMGIQFFTAPFGMSEKGSLTFDFSDIQSKEDFEAFVHAVRPNSDPSTCQLELTGTTERFSRRLIRVVPPDCDEDFVLNYDAERQVYVFEMRPKGDVHDTYTWTINDGTMQVNDVMNDEDTVIVNDNGALDIYGHQRDPKSIVLNGGYIFNSGDAVVPDEHGNYQAQFYQIETRADSFVYADAGHDFISTPPVDALHEPDDFLLTGHSLTKLGTGKFTIAAPRFDSGAFVVSNGTLAITHATEVSAGASLTNLVYGLRSRIELDADQTVNLVALGGDGEITGGTFWLKSATTNGVTTAPCFIVTSERSPLVATNATVSVASGETVTVKFAEGVNGSRRQILKADWEGNRMPDANFEVEGGEWRAIKKADGLWLYRKRLAVIVE